MHALSRKQLVLVVVLTLAWGLNWPVMKMGVTDFPPLTFRALSMWLGLPVLGAALLIMKVPFHIPRTDWRELLWLAATNMFVWHVCIILAIRTLSSGRAAILGYTMPIFSALLGALFFATPLTRRGWVGVGAAAVGVVLLLWHELSDLAGRPWGVGLALVRGMDGAGQGPAAGGLEPQRDDDSGAGRVQRRGLAARAGALAGLGRRWC